MAILAERLVHVIGVDTHKRTFTAAVLNNVGGVLESCDVEATAKGSQLLLAMAARYPPVRWAVEGTGSYGASLTEQLLGAGHAVTDVDRPKRGSRKRGKSDQIDAIRAGRDALAMKQLYSPTCLHASPETAALADACYLWAFCSLIRSAGARRY